MTADLLTSLRAACPALAVHTDDATLAQSGVDALRPSRGRPELAMVLGRPLAVVQPRDAAEVAAVVRWAGAERVPIVPRGGGSGLMGGAAVLGSALVVDLCRLDEIAVDAEACLVHAGAGATLARVDAALADHGLMLGHDPWTVAVATVGGVVSTNGLGYLGARAGNVGAQVRGLEAVLADGSLVRTPAVPAHSAGLDPTWLLVGTEGTLGVVTVATFAALPRPEERVVRGYRLPSFDAGVTVAAACRRTGVRLASLELSADGLPPRPGGLLLVFDGLRGEATLHAERAHALVAAAGGDALDPETARAQWDGRHAIAERWAARRAGVSAEPAPDDGGAQFDYAHVGVPLAGLVAVRAVLHDHVRQGGLALYEEGLWHWPELYSVVLGAPPGGAAPLRDAIDALCRAAQDAGGTMEYCHGVGWKLAHLAGREHGPAGRTLHARVKAALDPAGILNPGKAGL